MATRLKKFDLDSSQNLPSARNMKFAILVSEWNHQITGKLLEGAVDKLRLAGALQKNIIVRMVPGSFELPGAADILLSSGQFDAVICLGCIIQGETRHFEFISQAVANGLIQVSLKHTKPAIFGVLTTDNPEQAAERAGGRLGNKGIEAAEAAIKMVHLANSVTIHKS